MGNSAPHTAQPVGRATIAHVAQFAAPWDGAPMGLGNHRGRCGPAAGVLRLEISTRLFRDRDLGPWGRTGTTTGLSITIRC